MMSSTSCSTVWYVSVAAANGDALAASAPTYAAELELSVCTSACPYALARAPSA